MLGADSCAGSVRQFSVRAVQPRAVRRAQSTWSWQNLAQGITTHSHGWESLLCLLHTSGPSAFRIIRSVKMNVAMLMVTKTRAPWPLPVTRSFFTRGSCGSPRQLTTPDVVHPMPLLVLPYSQGVRIHPDQDEDPDGNEEDSRVMCKLARKSLPRSPPP